MIGNWKMLSLVVNRAQMFYKTVSESMLSLTDVEEATSGAADPVDQVDGCAGEPLLYERFVLGAWDGSTKQTFHIRQRFICTSVNLVYCYHCSRCGLLYIGETKRRVSDCFVEHLCS
eukprot:g25279.t1